MCVITEKLKERFCKDFNLPIKVYSEPYFSQRLSLFDKHYDCVKKYTRFVELVGRLGGEQYYFDYYNKVKDLAITYLNENEAMRYFSQEEDMSKYALRHTGLPKRDIYHMGYVGKCFVSFDMKRGNFTALRLYNPDTVGGAETYEDYLRMFTDEPHLLESKYVRQVIFGNMNPRRQVTYEHYLMDKVLDDVLTYTDVSKVVFFSTDEIVVELDESEVADKLERIYETVSKSCAEGINIRSEVFKLHKIEGTEGFVKEILDGDGEVVLKCVDALMMPLVLRSLYGEEPQEEDVVFLHDGLLAKLVHMPKVEVPKHLVRG